VKTMVVDREKCERSGAAKMGHVVVDATGS
jgi:hypothetical protein